MKKCEYVVRERDGAVWTVGADEGGMGFLTDPMNRSRMMLVGRCGKFFKDLLEAYESAAKNVGIWDTDKEE